MGKKLAVFVAIFLIVSFPVASSSVVNFKIYGEDEIEGFIRSTEHLKTFNVELDSEETPSFDDLIIEFVNYENQQFSFNDEVLCNSKSCVVGDFNPGIQNPYICECKTDIPFYHDRMSLILHFQENSLQRFVYKDYKPPEISKANLSQKDGNLSLELNVKDEGSDAHDKCVGLDKLFVTNFDQGFNFEYALPNDCYFEEEIIIPFNNDGTFDFQIKVVDRFWRNLGDDQKHAATWPINNFIVDFTEPNIHNTFSFNRNGMELNYISTDMLRANLSILIEDPNLENITLRNNYNNPDRNINNLSSDDGSCNQVNNNLYNCTFYDIGIILTEDDLVAKFDLVAIDSLGNEATKEITKEFLPAFGYPEVIFLGTTGYYERLGQSFVSKGENIFYVEIQNVISGVSENDIELNLANLNLSNNIPADKCYNENELWICEWNKSLILYDDGHEKRIILSSKKDITGNEINGISSVDVKIDLEEPKVNSTNSYSIIEGQYSTFHKTGDEIHIIANVSDDSGIKKALGDFSNLYTQSTGQLEQANCEFENGYYICKWITQPVRSGYQNVTVDLYFYDHAGNNKTIDDFRVIIYNPMDEEPDCYSLYLGDVRPIEVNQLRGLASRDAIYYQEVFFKLINNCAGAELYDLRLENGCSESIITYTNFSNDPCDNDSNCYNVHFAYPLSSASLYEWYDEYGITELVIGEDQYSKCSVSFYSKSNFNIYTIRERKNISFTLPIINLLVPPKENVKREIDSLLLDYERKGETTRKLTEVINSATQVCRLHTILGSVVLIINVARSILEGKGSVASAIATALGFVEKYIIKLREGPVGKVIAFMCAIVLCESPRQRLPGGDDGDASFESDWWTVLPGGLLGAAYNILSELYDRVNFAEVLKTTINETTEETEFTDTYDFSFSAVMGTPLDLAKSNFWVALGGLCLPGVLYNIDRDNQLECWRGLCKIELVSSGIPSSACDEMYSYQRCIYRKGVIDALIQFFGISTIVNALDTYLDNPFLLVWPLSKYTAARVCEKATGSTTLVQTLCATYKAIDVIEMSITSYRRIEDTIKSFDYDETGYPNYCEQLREKTENHPDWQTTTSSEPNNDGGDFNW